MPPTRGHDLKPGGQPYYIIAEEDAPHTGARLETLPFHPINRLQQDAPHTGARLETCQMVGRGTRLSPMPPTRGHDLKRCGSIADSSLPLMPPTRGHDLKLFHIFDILKR